MKTSANSWRLKFWRFPFLAGVEMLHAENITHDYPRHMHEVHSIGVLLQGNETTFCQGVPHLAHAGSVITINAEEAHANQSVNSSYRLIKIKPRVLTELALEHAVWVRTQFPFTQLVMTDRRLFAHLLKIHLLLEDNRPALEQESHFIAAMGMLLTRHNAEPAAGAQPKTSRDISKIGMVRDYLKAHSAENVSLSRLSSIAGLSRFYLLRAFRDRIGFPPHEYQTQLRIAEARRMIRQGHSLSETAVATGFVDQSHFSRSFKRIVGVPPGHYMSHSNIVQDTLGRF